MDQYTKVKSVGRGAHGMAYLCRRKSDNAPVVIKQLLTTSMTEAEKQSSMNEINVLTMLRHPNIVAYFDSVTVQLTTPDQDPFANTSAHVTTPSFAGDISVSTNCNPSSASTAVFPSPSSQQQLNLSPLAHHHPPTSQLQVPNMQGSPIRKLPSSTGLDTSFNTLARSPSKKVLERRPSVMKTNPKIPSTLMIIMEYADGGTLSDFLESRKGFLDESLALRMICQITLAVLHIHSLNILHRDLKTNNIFISGSGDSIVLKIGDFGISKVVSSLSLSNADANTLVGTPAYLSPELCEGKGHTQKSDIWALGCIFYEIVTLKKMFCAHNLPALVLKILKGAFEPIPGSFSKETASLIASCVDLDPIQRPSTSDILCRPFMQDVLVDVIFAAGRC